MKPLLVACLATALALSCRLACAAAPAPMPASDTELHCPTTLAQAPVADGVPAGWIVRGETGRLPLQRAAFYDGDPVGLGTLAPDTTRRSGLIETSTWSFAQGESAHVWLGCLYRDVTAVVARPLPSGLHQCTTVLRLTPLGDPSGPLSVRCR
jgi:hypothetical protein